MNIHLLLMSKNTQDQEQQVSSFRCLSLEAIPEKIECRYAFPGPGLNKKWGPNHDGAWMRRGRTFSMQIKYEYTGYELCGILAFDWHHAKASAVERYWVFYGSSRGGYSGWCKIVSTATILELGKRHGFFTTRDWSSQGSDEIEMKEAENDLWESPHTWEWIVGLKGGYRPGKEAEERSRTNLAWHLSASLERQVFLGHYNHLALSLDILPRMAPVAPEWPPQDTRRDKKNGRRN